MVCVNVLPTIFSEPRGGQMERVDYNGHRACAICLVEADRLVHCRDGGLTCRPALAPWPSTSRAAVMSPPLAAVTTALTTLGIVGHELLGEAGGAVPGTGLHAGRIAATAGRELPALPLACVVRGVISES